MELTKQEYLSIYGTMVKIRAFDETAAGLSASGELPGFVHPYSGEEAIAAGVCSELSAEDCICSTHRGHGHIIAKGGDVKRMMAELFGKATGYSQGKSGSMHIADFSLGIIGANGIVGASIPIANGVAFALDYLGKDAVCVAFFGDGASNRGTFHEALNLASAWDLPVIFVCENNGFASSTPRREAMKTDRIASRAAGYGMTGATVDGNDPVAVKEAVREAVSRLRRGAGQTLLECLTWRHHQHFVGDVTAYKDPVDQARWLSPEMDPIPRFESLLKAKGVADAAELADIQGRARAEIVGAVAYAKASPDPTIASMHEFVYVD
jgi:pyruvate dehydrogenase E1 component alpha subunit